MEHQLRNPEHLPNRSSADLELGSDPRHPRLSLLLHGNAVLQLYDVVGSDWAGEIHVRDLRTRSCAGSAILPEIGGEAAPQIDTEDSLLRLGEADLVLEWRWAAGVGAVLLPGVGDVPGVVDEAGGVFVAREERVRLHVELGDAGASGGGGEPAAALGHGCADSDGEEEEGGAVDGRGEMSVHQAGGGDFAEREERQDGLEELGGAEHLVLRLGGHGSW